MNAFEAIGLFWVILATGCFTAGTLIAAAWAVTLGLKVALRCYKLGESMERTLEGQPEGRRLER